MRAVHYHSPEGVHCAVLGSPGRKFTKMAVIDFPVKLRKVVNYEADRYSREMLDTTVKKIARKMLAVGKRRGITKGAKQLLRDALKFTPPQGEQA